MNDINTQDNGMTTTSASAQRVVSASSSLAIPIAIIIGFGLIAASIYFSESKAPANLAQNTGGAEQPAANLDAIAPITDADHIRGNPNAPIVIVEYSDYDCPFCRNFHMTLQKVMDEYGASGKVAWVYRHFPLTQLHPSAEHIAEASECVAELGGNEAFWKFSDLVFLERGVNELTDVSRLPEFASSAGVDKAKFEECLDSGRHASTVEEDSKNAIATGGRGTPHSIIVAGDQKLEIGGAQPYEVVKPMIEGLLE